MGLYAFDGTWNEQKTEEDLAYRNTNVSRFYDAFRANSGRKEFYVEGVGTRYDIIGQIVGGIFGAGVLPRLHEAYDHLCQAWEDGDREIDIIGFSTFGLTNDIGGRHHAVQRVVFVAHPLRDIRK